MIFAEAELEMISFSHIILIQTFKYAIVACYFMRLFLPAVLPVSGSYGCVTLATALMSVFHLSSSHLTRLCNGNFGCFIPTCLSKFRIKFIESVTSFVQ